MRMWMVNPKIMCSKHLCGEHGEIHKHRHNFVKGHSMSGRILENCLEPSSLQSRHDELEKELNFRQGDEGRRRTSSPFDAPDISYLPVDQRLYKIDVEKNLQLLISRCHQCKQRYLNFVKKKDVRLMVR